MQLKKLLEDTSIGLSNEEKLQILNIFDAELFVEDDVPALILLLLDSDSGIRDKSQQIILHSTDAIKKRAAENLVDVLRSPNIENRNLAIDTLIRLQHHSSKPLMNFLNDPDYLVRQYAIDILGKTGDYSTIIELKKLIYNDNLNVVNSAIEAIGDLGTLSESEFLIDLFDKINEELKPTILDSLGKIGGDKSINFLLQQIDCNDTFIRLAAIEGLSLCGDSIGISNLLIEKMEEFPEMLQRNILKTISAISFRMDERIDLPLRYRHIASSALMDDDEDVRIAGLLALGEEYLESDLDGLMLEMSKANEDTQFMILSNIIQSNDVSLVRSFFEKMLDILTEGLSKELFLESLSNTWLLSSDYNKGIVIDILVRYTLESRSNYPMETIETLLILDRIKTVECLKQRLNEIQNDNPDLFFDIISHFGLIELEYKSSNNTLN